MDGPRMTRAIAGLAVACLAIAGCDGEAPRDTVRMQVEEVPDYMRETGAEQRQAPALSEAAQTTVDRLRGIIQTNSLYRLSQFADTHPGFISNFAGASHRAHWDLLRRTGFDPVLRMEDLLDGPYGVRDVGGETWYVWPALAALDSSELQPERLSFRQRARLEELVGEAGIAEIRNGGGYPGVRMAIAEDGRWLYYVHETQK